MGARRAHRATRTTTGAGRIIDASNEAYRGLQADPRAWQDLHEERAAWEATLGDGRDEA
jgi:hypothetical protein